MADRDRPDDDRLWEPAWEEAWPAPEPPADFADRVARASSGADVAPREAAPALPRPGRSRARRLLGAASAAALAALVAGLFLALRMPRPATPLAGEVQAHFRTAIALGPRGVAVAEPGTTVRFAVDPGGAARIDQPYGEAFYRVEHGGPFVVRTPSADVVALGTCFRVEVEPMSPTKHLLVGAAAGAALTATIVTVYEGRVAVRNAHGQSDVGPGERLAVRADAPPGPVAPSAVLEAPPAGATREDLLARDQQQRERIASLERQLADARKGMQVRAGEGNDGRHGPRRDKFFDFSPDELREMAKNCEVRFDLPDFGLEPGQMSSKQASQLGLSEEDRAAYNRVLGAQNADFMQQLRALYGELTGDAAGAQNLDVRTLESEIQAKSPRAEESLARAQLAQERAGLAPAADPKGLSVYARYLRLMTGAGDAFQRALGQTIGADKAERLRGAEGANASRSVMRGCPDR